MTDRLPHPVHDGHGRRCRSVQPQFLPPRHEEELEGSSASTEAETEVMMMMDEEASGVDDFKGLRLVHLLMAAAEALSSINASRDLARVILIRLKELVSPTHGSNIARGEMRYVFHTFDIMEGIQWASLIQALSSTRKDGPHPRINCLFSLTYKFISK